MGSLAPGAWQPDLDAPRRHLGVSFLALEVELGPRDVGVAGELPHFVYRRPVAALVRDRAFGRVRSSRPTPGWCRWSARRWPAPTIGAMPSRC